jgi:hypothetical protein
MSAPVSFVADDAVELVELLSVVAELCESFPLYVNDMLGSLLGAGYDAFDLRTDVARLADALAQSMGFADASMKADR